METATMPVFYHLPFVILAGTVCSAILTVGFAWLIRKKGWKGWDAVPFVLTFGAVSWLISILLVNFFGYPVQAAIAVPYIQAALDEESECEGYDLFADARGFYVDSGYGWASEDSRATCYHSNIWICSCSP